MNEPLSSASPTPDQNLAAQRTHSRLWALTIASLCLNGVILLMLLAFGIAMHHHREMQREHFAESDRNRPGDEGSGSGFRHHFRGEMKHEGGRFGKDRDDDGGFRDHHEWRDDDRGDFGRDRDHDFGGRRHDHGPMDGGSGQPPDPTQMTDGILNRLTEQLTLSDDQKAKIKPILQQQVTEIQKQMEDNRQAIQKQIESDKAKIKPILNPDQQKQFDQLPVPGDDHAEQPPAPAANP